jgi:hypothetical protein
VESFFFQNALSAAALANFHKGQTWPPIPAGVQILMVAMIDH